MLISNRVMVIVRIDRGRWSIGVRHGDKYRASSRLQLVGHELVNGQCGSHHRIGQRGHDVQG